MNEIIKEITHELQDDIVKYEAILKDSLKSNVKLINMVVNYAIKRKGKQFRPLLCILCSRLNNLLPNDSTFLSAATVEILHVATLLHDDVVDDAYIRRSWPSVNKIWKNKLSILIGDYMFSKSLNIISKLDKIENIRLLASISDRLSEGEILQIEKAKKKEMTEDVYYKMISDKTASLISGACYLGYVSNGSNMHKENIKNFGEYLGIAYQLKDDLFDVVGKLDEIGKSSNLDLKKNMLTLPYIYAINHMGNDKKKHVISKLKYYYNRKDIKEIKKIIINSGGIEYTESKIKEYSQRAIIELNVFDKSKYKDLLIKTIEFNLNRKF